MKYTTIKTPQGSFIIDPDNWLRGRNQSPYFTNLLSGKWGDKQADGSYFVAADTAIFEHILRYLRTGVLPVFYTQDKGHDYVLYQAVLGEARYFGIDRLITWLETQKYLDAVKVTYKNFEMSGSSNVREIMLGSSQEMTALPQVLNHGVVWCFTRKEIAFDHELCVKWEPRSKKVEL